MLSSLSSSYRVHGSSRRDVLVLVAELGDLQEGIDAIAFQAVDFEAAGPVFC
jgi:hypothetical protein